MLNYKTKAKLQRLSNKKIAQKVVTKQKIILKNIYIETDVENLRLHFLAHKSERITPRVKSQARS